MNAKDFLAGAPPMGPSAHRQMTLPDRIALYRRVIAALRICEKPLDFITWRQGFELRSAVGESMLITRCFDNDAHKHLRLMLELLTSALQEMELTSRKECENVVA